MPFGTALSGALPPSDPRDRFDLGAGQLAGALSLLLEAGALAGGGAGAAVTIVGIPVAVGAEAAAAVMAVGALANAAAGIYNMATGDSSGRGGGNGMSRASPGGSGKYKWGECDKFARDLQTKLQTQGKAGAQVTVRPPGKYYALESKQFGKLGGPGGDHIAVESEGRIYDNFRPDGVPAEEFWNDLVESDFLRGNGYTSVKPF